MYDSSMVTTDRHFTKDESLDPSRPALLLIDVQPRRAEARMNCPHWLLALAIPFSRSDRARAARRWCRSFHRFQPKLPPEVPGDALTGRSPGLITLTGQRGRVNVIGFQGSSESEVVGGYARGHRQQ